MLVKRKFYINGKWIDPKNKKDIEEIQDSYLKGLKFYFIKEMKEVIEISVTNQIVRGAKNFTTAKKL